jgi:hypothetical protein
MTTDAPRGTEIVAVRVEMYDGLLMARIVKEPLPLPEPCTVSHEVSLLIGIHG